jgi:hypothetical protein
MRLVAFGGILAGLAAVLAVPAAAPRPGAGEPDAVPFVQVSIDGVTPDVVTTTSDTVVTVTGTVSNIGDRRIHDVVLRLEHAAAVASSAGLRTNLDGPNDQFRPVDNFATVADELQRGQDVRFTLSAPVRSLENPSLQIDRPGIYPILVNVNGTPDYGDRARLDDARFLLPVSGVPVNPDEPTADPLTAVVAPDTSKPVKLTMLWPLADRPRLTPGVPGGSKPARLSDDELAVSLAAGGRLDVLLSAAEFATNPTVDPDGAVGRSLCLAVDPDLVVTVNAMAGGYVVSDSPDSAATRAGTGQTAATAWLDRLRALARHVCVAASPYAQADLNALQRVGDADLDTAAVAGSHDVVDQILGVTTTRGATLLGDGSLTSKTVDLLSGQGNTVAITAGDSSAQNSVTGAPPTTDVAPRRVSPQVVAAPFDPAVGAALAASGTAPIAPTYLDPSLDVRLGHASIVARREDALGSMLWRALEPSAAPRVEILVPPTTWAPQPDDARAVLTTLATTIRAGLAVPRPLAAAVVEAQAAAGAPQPQTSEMAARGRFDDDVTTDIADQIGQLRGVTAALTTDARTGLTGVGYTAPLREDMLRALSQSEPPGARTGLALHRLSLVGKAIDDMYAGVTIVNPGGSYTLATERSPLPLVLRNDLAVPIRVRLEVDAPPGMSVSDVGEIELPPGYLPVRVPIEVHFNQRVAVDVALRTPAGLPLGEPVRLSVHANAYGKVLFALTLTAAAVLVALAGRRLWHRFRGQPDPADLDRPDLDEAQRLASHDADEHPADEKPPT